MKINFTIKVYVPRMLLAQFFPILASIFCLIIEVTSGPMLIGITYGLFIIGLIGVFWGGLHLLAVNSDHARNNRHKTEFSAIEYKIALIAGATWLTIGIFALIVSGYYQVYIF